MDTDIFDEEGNLVATLFESTAQEDETGGPAPGTQVPTANGDSNQWLPENYFDQLGNLDLPGCNCPCLTFPVLWFLDSRTVSSFPRTSLTLFFPFVCLDMLRVHTASTM
eukprot:m.442985 g.442985  ORF g.442985 m.442985 type:complete len:109 (+) comp18896_c0_seq1:121-447(+)